MGKNVLVVSASLRPTSNSVSYTHLDVYKRQSTPSSPTPKSARHTSGNSHGRFGLRSTSGNIAAATYAPAASPPSVVNKNKGNSEIIVIIRPHLDPGAADDPPRRLFLTGPQPSHAASS